MAATAAVTGGWYDGEGKDGETAVCYETVLHQSSFQLTSLSAIVDVKSANEKSATSDWRISGSPF